MRGGVLTMMSESELNLLNRLLATKDREESIKLATELYQEMSQEEIIATVDKSLEGYREASAAAKAVPTNIS